MQAALASRPSTAKLQRAEIVNLCDLARKQLEHHPHFRGRSGGIEIEQRGKTLLVSGRLPSFYLKQLVQETLRHVPGVQSVSNDIQVVRSDGISSV
jgi:osmotically-inducible protein OsmY